MVIRSRLSSAAVTLVASAVLLTTLLQAWVHGFDRGLLPRQVTSAVITLLGLGGLAALAARRFAGSLTAPASRALDAVLTREAVDEAVGQALGDDEVLLAAEVCGRLDRMLADLRGDVRAAAQRLSSAETAAADALSRQELAVQNFSGTAHQIAAAVAEISATGEQLLEATGQVTGVAREAAEVAEQGRGGLERMAASMAQLDDAMNTFTTKLATISQRAAGITAVVTTIAKVADQTNLLSVNATIEAEKAGDAGRGFRIVAQEIRRLADQTALATKDIERLVRDMQAAVAGGTMEMDRFRNEVSARIGEVTEVSGSLGRIIDPVQSVTRSLDQVHEGMTAQSEGARQIRDAMDTLRDGAGESAASIESISSALQDLRKSIDTLASRAERPATFNDGLSAEQPGTAAVR
jgi:methyl-accepting chemotaxis protein WspA